MTTGHHLHPDQPDHPGHDELGDGGLWECHELSVQHPDGSSSCLSAEPCGLPHELHHWTLSCDDLDWPCTCVLEHAFAAGRSDRHAVEATTIHHSSCTLAA